MYSICRVGIRIAIRASVKLFFVLAPPGKSNARIRYEYPVKLISLYTVKLAFTVKRIKNLPLTSRGDCAC